MLTTLKDIFRPTRAKIGWTLATGIPLTLFGFALAFASVHGSDLLAYIAGIFLLPTFILSRVAPYASLFYSNDVVVVVLFLILQFSYFYVIVGVVTLLLGKAKRVARVP